MHFTATQQSLPATISLKAKLAWHYFYRGYDLIRTKNGCFLITRNNRNLDEAIAFATEAEFISHLERETDRALQTDSVKFFKSFVMFSELVTQNVAVALEQALTPPSAPVSSSAPTPLTSQVTSANSSSASVPAASGVTSVSTAVNNTSSLAVDSTENRSNGDITRVATVPNNIGGNVRDE